MWYYYYYNSNSNDWCRSLNSTAWFKDSVSKEDDLKMSKEAGKQVSCIEDLEIGMFLKHIVPDNYYLVVSLTPLGLKSVTESTGVYTQSDLSNFSAWSYTYKDNYQPFIKVSETDIKIKELEDTIAQAQQQLKELKELQK